MKAHEHFIILVLDGSPTRGQRDNYSFQHTFTNQYITGHNEHAQTRAHVHLHYVRLLPLFEPIFLSLSRAGKNNLQKKNTTKWIRKEERVGFYVPLWSLFNSALVRNVNSAFQIFTHTWHTHTFIWGKFLKALRAPHFSHHNRSVTATTRCATPRKPADSPSEITILSVRSPQRNRPLLKGLLHK